MINSTNGLMKAYIAKQFKEKRPDLHPMQIIMSVMGMIWFPFIARPLFLGTGTLNDTTFKKMMIERKELIPVFVMAMLKKK